MTKISAAVMENFVPEMSVFGLPYVFRDGDHYWRVLDGRDRRRRCWRRASPSSLRGLCYYDSGSRNFYTDRKPIRTPEISKGLKIRVMNSTTAIDMVKAMGGAPDPDRLGRALLGPGPGHGGRCREQPAELHLQQALRGVQTLHPRRTHPHPRRPLDRATKTWDRLSPQIREWIQQAADDSSEFQRELWHRKRPRNRWRLARAEGVTIYEVDLAPFAAKVAPMLEEVEDPAVRSLVRTNPGDRLRCRRSADAQGRTHQRAGDV